MAGRGAVSLFLCRASLCRDAPSAALADLLVPTGDGARAGAAHRLVWALFADGPERRRDFLWREEGPGRFLALSARPPADPHGLFRLEWRPFEPALAPGDRLNFALRANPVVARSDGPGQRGRRHDVVMDAIRAVPASARAEERRRAVQAAGRAWLERQGTAHGFALAEAPDAEEGDHKDGAPRPALLVEGYDRVTVPRAGARPAVFGMLDFAGVLVVRDPVPFLAGLAAGFGRTRAFGCGLMLVRRAAP